MVTDAPGELLEGAESNHGSHPLTGRRERCVEEDVADTGCVHHAVVVQVGGERHPIVLRKKKERNIGIRLHSAFNVRMFNLRTNTENIETFFFFFRKKKCLTEIRAS